MINELLLHSKSQAKSLDVQGEQKLQSTRIIPTLDTTTKYVIQTTWLAQKTSLKRWQLIRNYAVALLFNTSSNIHFGYLLESPQWGNSNKYPKHMVYKEIKLNMAFVAYHYTHSLQQQIHFNSNIFGNNAVVVTRVHCILFTYICLNI